MINATETLEFDDFSMEELFGNDDGEIPCPPYEFKHARYCQIPVCRDYVLDALATGTFRNPSNPMLEYVIAWRYFQDEEMFLEYVKETRADVNCPEADVKFCNLVRHVSDKVIIAKPRLIEFTQGEVDALRSAHVTERQRRLLTVFIALLKSRDWTTMWRFPKFSVLCRAAGVKYGRGLSEFQRVAVRSGLFEDNIAYSLECLEHGLPLPVYELHLNLKPSGLVVATYRDVFEVYEDGCRNPLSGR